MLRSTVLLGLALLASTAASSVAQPAAPTAAAARIDGRAAVADIRRILAANYVLPETRPKLDAVLAKGLAEGRYDVADRSQLIERINADLSSVAHDKHLGLDYDPQAYARLIADPPGAGADDAPASPQDIRRATRRNHGIASLKLLPGNVRYMEYDGFNWVGAKTSEALDTAMRFLRDGDAVIIDLRHNGGGSPEAVQYLISHFLEPNRKLVTFYMHGNPADPFSTLASLPAGRMVGKPLYVLISGNTGSAAEEFTGHVAGFKLGELIGATTAGAGYRNQFYPVTGGFVISVSVGRAVLASTGKDWEGVGIPPTTKVHPDDALDVAEIHAWRKLAATADANEKRMLQANADLAEAKLNHVATALPLASYAGSYGERSLSVAGNRLWWQRGDGPKLAMVALGPNIFSFDEDPVSRVTFTTAGAAVTGFKMVRADGSVVEGRRTP